MNEGLYELIDSIQFTNRELQNKLSQLKEMLHDILPPGTTNKILDIFSTGK